MGLGLCIGHDLPSGFGRLIEQPLGPKSVCHDAAGIDEMVHPGTHDMSPPEFGCGPRLRPPSVDQRLGVLAKEKERPAEQPFGAGKIEWIGVVPHDHLGSPTKSKCALEVFAPK